MSYSAIFAGNDLKLASVVIDPGHGGKDAGAVSKDKKSYEKNYTLDISTQLADMIKEAYPDVKVKLTRSRDEFISLQERADIANRQNAQLFISIHINSTASTSPNGYSVHVLGQSSNKNRDLFAFNMDVCKRENSVIMLEDDYSTKYEGFDPSDTESYIFMTLMQNSNLEQSLKFAQDVQNHLKGGPIKADRGIWQNPFYVLWKTSMPSVLVELGFISNQSDLAVLTQKSKRTELAQRIFAAFEDYKKNYDRTVSIDVATPEQESVPVPVAETPSKERYGIQVVATSKTLLSSADVLMGYNAEVIRVGSINKYIIAVSEDLQTVRKKLPDVRKKSPDAFIVKLSEGTVEPVR